MQQSQRPESSELLRCSNPKFDLFNAAASPKLARPLYWAQKQWSIFFFGKRSIVSAENESNPAKYLCRSYKSPA